VNYLRDIVERKRREVARRRRRPIPGDGCEERVPVDDARLERACAALRRRGSELPRVIAEIKMRSPSAGLIRRRLPGEVASIARAYEAAGASAVSVLCDGPAFGGCPLDVRRVASAVSVPVLFKEFVIDRSQIRLARLLGADMVLLIARILGERELRELAEETARQGMAPVVEIANEEQLRSALSQSAPIIGINARDLTSFSVDPAVAARIVGMVPDDRIKIYMSGVSTREDLARLADTSADAVLIGESLMRAPRPGARLREILDQGRPGK
jgi:indole-3-glycerol phosphate synthase